MKSEMYQSIQDFLIRKMNPTYIIIFGSYAKNSTHKDSDIDVAFYSEDHSITTYDIFQLAQELANQLKIEVDLVNLHTASTVFQAQIYTTGTVIYSIDDRLLKNQQMTALSMYSKLKEDETSIKDTDDIDQLIKNDVILNKINSIKRCLNHIHEIYANDPSNLSDFIIQDSIILNIQRACEASKDLAKHIGLALDLGVPETTLESFNLLVKHSIIDEELALRLKRIRAKVKFLTIIVHEDPTLSIRVLKEIIDSHYDDFVDYINQISEFQQGGSQ